MSACDALIFGDCIPEMGRMENNSVDLVFADPPFNIGLNYDGGFNDKLTPADYIAWTQQWLDGVAVVMKPNASIYVAIGDEFAGEMAVELKKRFHWRNNICWYYTFGESQRGKFNRCHTNILYYTKSPTDFTFNTDTIKIPSARQWKYKDKRAKSGGKLPDDCWEVPNTDWLKDIIRSSEDMRDRGMSEVALDKLVDEITCAFVGDFWKISRVCGTFKERITTKDGSSHPCQMPLSILHRIIKASSNEGDVVLDPFLGTGTTAAAAKSLARHYVGIERSQTYYDVAKERLNSDAA